MASRDWPNLAQHAKDRREELGLTQEAVAASGGPSTATLRLIENMGAKSYRAKSLSQLETALRWRSGSVRSVLAGGEPEPLGPEGEGDKRLGKLSAYRVAMDPDYRRRDEFASARGISYQLVYDFERARRFIFEPEEIAALANAYNVPEDTVRSLSLLPALEDPELTRILKVWPDTEATARRVLASVAEQNAHPPASPAEAQRGETA